MNIKLFKISNPHSIFVLSWSLALFLYSLGWAEIFPKISTPLFIFIAIAIALFGLTGFFLNRVKVLTPTINKNELKYKTLLVINTILWIMNFLYSKEIPLLTGVRDENFGIPTVYVFTVGLNSFCSVYCYYIYLFSREKKYLLFSAYCLLFYVLVISRGSIIMPLFTMFFVWMSVRKPNMTFKRFILIVFSFLILIYAFGVAGNLRTQKEISSYNASYDATYNSDVILNIGQASESFKNNIVPNEFFWVYLYLTSPISNLQYNINVNSPGFSFDGVTSIMMNEILFDSASKRINEYFNITPQRPVLIIDALTVCTSFAGSYVFAGWGGMVFLLLFYWIFPVLFKFLIINNPLGVIGSSTLCTIYFFSMFDNMFIISALVTTMILPIVVNFFNKINFKTNPNHTK